MDINSFLSSVSSRSRSSDRERIRNIDNNIGCIAFVVKIFVLYWVVKLILLVVFGVVCSIDFC